MLKLKVFSIGLMVGIIGLGGFFLTFSNARAQIPWLFGPFGGRVIMAAPCLFPPAMIIFITPTINAAMPPMVIFQPGFSLPFMYYNYYTPGVAVLGRTAGMSVCLTYVPPFVIPAPLVQMIGSSLLPAI